MDNTEIKYTKQSIEKDGANIVTHSWTPENFEKAIVLVHGMAEHVNRYKNFAEYIAKKNIATFSMDLRGHGETAETQNDLGYFGKNISFHNLISDVVDLINSVKIKYANIPIILFGHSMGSFISQGVIQQNIDLDGCILSGTGMPNPMLAKTGHLLAGFIKSAKGENYKSKFLDSMAFSSYQKRIPNAKTKFDWLSTDSNEVQKYIDDPKCGFLCSASFFYELTGLNLYIQNRTNISNIKKDLPIYFFAGKDDPVGNYNQDIKKLIAIYKNLGVKNITEKYYSNGRHEMLNEVSREEVKNDILNWILGIEK